MQDLTHHRSPCVTVFKCHGQHARCMPGGVAVPAGAAAACDTKLRVPEPMKTDLRCRLGPALAELNAEILLEAVRLGKASGGWGGTAIRTRLKIVIVVCARRQPGLG